MFTSYARMMTSYALSSLSVHIHSLLSMVSVEEMCSHLMITSYDHV